MVKILITTIQVNFVPIDQAAPNSPELSLLKFLPLTYHHSHFLAATLDFTFFHHSLFKGRTPFFTAWLFLIRFHFFLYLYIPKPAYGQLWGFLTYIFFFTTGKEKDEADFINSLTHSDFISKCTHYIYNAYIKSSLYYELLHIFITCQLIPTG